jgi:hypothetical protein
MRKTSSRSSAFNSLSHPCTITRKAAEEKPNSLGTQAKAWHRDGERRLLKRIEILH